MSQEPFDRSHYRWLLGLAVGALVVGTVFYRFVEHLTWLDAYYLSVITLTTVGYGDVTPHTHIGKIFTTFYIFFGVGILGTFISYNVRRQAWRRQKREPDNSTSD